MEKKRNKKKKKSLILVLVGAFGIDQHKKKKKINVDQKRFWKKNIYVSKKLKNCVSHTESKNQYQNMHELVLFFDFFF